MCLLSKQKSNTYRGRSRAAAAAAAAAVSRYPLPHTSGLATLLAAAMAAFAIHKTHTTCLSSRTRTAAVCDMHVVIDARNRRERGTTLLKRTRRVTPRPIYKAASACAEMLWCGELERVHSLAIAVVDYFERTLFEKQCVNSSFIIKFVIRSCPSGFAIRKSTSFSGSDTLLQEMVSSPLHKPQIPDLYTVTFSIPHGDATAGWLGTIAL